ARSLLQAVLQRSPADVTARTYLRNTHWGRARVLGQLGKHTEAIADWDKAIELSPAAEQTRCRLARSLALVQGGQAAKAIADAEAVLKAGVNKARDYYDLACVYSLGSAAEKAKDGPLAEQHAARAVELLKQAEA